MELPKPDFISVQEAARQLENASEERILFFLKNKHLTAYVPLPPAYILYPPENHKPFMFAKADVAEIDKDKIYISCIYILAEDTMEIICKDTQYAMRGIENIKISYREIENLRSQDTNKDFLQIVDEFISLIGTGQVTDDMRYAIKDAFFKQESNKEKEQIVDKFIAQMRNKKVHDKIIAYLLCQEGHFKLSYKEIGTKFDSNGLNKDQHDAIKSRGYRFCKKGRALLHGAPKKK